MQNAHIKDGKRIREDATGQKFEITYDVAGKSTISFQMRDYVGTIIDPDQIAKRINLEDPRSADLSAGREAVKQIRELIGRKENFAIETTLSGSFVLRHMRTVRNRVIKSSRIILVCMMCKCILIG